MAAPFRAILSKSVFSKYLDRLHGKKLLADDKILIKKKNTVKEKNRAEGKWARASSDERRTMQDWTLQVDYRLKGPLLLKLPDTGLQEAIRSSDHPLKIPPYGRLSINWSGKSNCAFVFAVHFFRCTHAVIIFSAVKEREGLKSTISFGHRQAKVGADRCSWANLVSPAGAGRRP